MERSGPFDRVLLIAHRDCREAGRFLGVAVSPVSARRAVHATRSAIVGRARARFGVEPELWFLDERGARRVRARAKALPSVGAHWR